MPYVFPLPSELMDSFPKTSKPPPLFASEILSIKDTGY